MVDFGKDIIEREIRSAHNRLFKDEVVDLVREVEGEDERWVVNGTVVYEIIDVDWEGDRWDIQFKVGTIAIGHVQDEEVS